MIYAFAMAIVSLWTGTGIVWWTMESQWNGRAIHPMFRLYRAVDWLPAFIGLPSLGGRRFYEWMLGRYVSGDRT